MYLCGYVCCIPTIINKWVNCNLTWMWRRLLAARSPRSLRSSREQVGTNLKKNCLWDFSSIKRFHTWEWWLGWPRGSWAIAARRCLSWLLTKTRLHLTPWKSVRTYLPIYHQRSPKITQDITQDLTRRCQGNSCPCRLFRPRLVGPKRHRPHQEPDHRIMLNHFHVF